MTQKLLCEVEEKFQITGRGLVLFPNFSVPGKGAWSNLTTKVEIESQDGIRTTYEAQFLMSHYNISDPNAPMDKRWRIELVLPDVEKEAVDIGSKIFVSTTDYIKIKNVENA